MAKRLAKALPPNLLTPDQKDIPPQLQAILQAMQAQIQQMAQERQQLVAALNEKTSDRAQRQDEIDKAFTAKMAALEEKFTEALVKLGGKRDDTIIKESMIASREMMKKFAEGVNARMIAAHNTMEQKIMAQLGKPKKAKLKRNSDGTVEVVSEFAEPDSKQ